MSTAIQESRKPRLRLNVWQKLALIVGVTALCGFLTWVYCEKIATPFGSPPVTGRPVQSAPSATALTTSAALLIEPPTTSDTLFLIPSSRSR